VNGSKEGQVKGKEEYFYSAFLAKVVHSRHLGMDHTVLPANNTMPAFPSSAKERQRTSNCSSLLIYRPRKDERLSWPSWLTYSGWFTQWSPISYRSSAGERSMLYCWTTQPTSSMDDRAAIDLWRPAADTHRTTAVTGISPPFLSRLHSRMQQATFANS